MTITSWIIILAYLAFAITALIAIIYVKRGKVDVSGKPPFNKVLFSLTKIALFITPAAMLVQSFGVDLRFWAVSGWLEIAAIIILIVGMIIVVISFVNLGKALRFGLAKEETKLKTVGLYKISRNPMYLGVYLLELSAIIYTLNLIFILLGAIAILAHHKIILAEEKDLKKKFGQDYINYCQKVRRYI